MEDASHAPEWVAALRLGLADAGETLPLASLKAGDRLRVTTANTTYEFQMLGGRDAELQKGREDRPSGCVRLNGCTFGCSSTIAPDRIFCGGSIEFSFDAGWRVHTTTAIREIVVLRRRT